MILEFKNVTGKSRKFGLKDVSFQLEKGYVMGLAGKNGAGKSTLLDYIMDPKGKYSGEIFLDGENILENHTEILNYLGFVSENNIFFETVTAKQNSELLGIFYKEWNQESFEAHMEKMGVGLDLIVKNMSRGEYMKFQMAFAMAHKPKLYLIDEATSKMDPVFRKDFYNIMHEIIEDESASIILVTHLEEELEFKVDYVGIMENGKMISFNEVI